MLYLGLETTKGTYPAGTAFDMKHAVKKAHSLANKRRDGDMAVFVATDAGKEVHRVTCKGADR